MANPARSILKALQLLSNTVRVFDWVSCKTVYKVRRYADVLEGAQGEGGVEPPRTLFYSAIWDPFVSDAQNQSARWVGSVCVGIIGPV